MDLSTMIGFVMGTALLVWGMFDASNADLGIYWSAASIAIVVGGGISAVLISVPLGEVVAMFKVIRKAILHKEIDAKQLIADLVSYAELARRDGILALESVTAKIEFEFLVKGIRLAIDGTEPELIDTILNTELEYLAKRHQTGKLTADLMGKYAPAFGMIGTLVGLIAMLANLGNGNLDSIGPAMGVALITTLYGAIMGNFVFLPIADKLAARSTEEKIIYEMVILGVMSIQQGDNPRIVQQKLSIFLPPSNRPEEE